jgi:hypothetical protein
MNSGMGLKTFGLARRPAKWFSELANFGSKMRLFKKYFF